MPLIPSPAKNQKAASAAALWLYQFFWPWSQRKRHATASCDAKTRHTWPATTASCWKPKKPIPAARRTLVTESADKVV